MDLGKFDQLRGKLSQEGDELSLDKLGIGSIIGFLASPILVAPGCHGLEEISHGLSNDYWLGGRDIGLAGASCFLYSSVSSTMGVESSME